LLAVPVLRSLFRRLFLEGLVALYDAHQLQFFNDLAVLSDRVAFLSRLAPLRKRKWVVYGKRVFAGPEQVLAYLARYTHRVAIGNSRLIEQTDEHVVFRWKDYRENGRTLHKVMKLTAGEFIRRFLLHVLPDGFNRIRHYGLFANGHHADKLALCRRLLNVPQAGIERPGIEQPDDKAAPPIEPPPCPCCGGRMKLVESFEGSHSRPTRAWRADTS
jgi:hypothetical protein